MYHNQSESVNRMIDLQTKNLGFKCIFANLAITTKVSDQAKLIADFARSVKSRNTDQSKSPGVFVRVTLVMQVSDKVVELLDTTVKSLRNNRLVECLCIRPANESQFLDLLSHATYYDMISLDVSNGNFFQQVSACIKSVSSSKVVVELEISQAARGSNELSNLISQTRLVFARSGNAIVSSGAKSVFELKSSLDLSNWACNILKIPGTRRVLDRLVQTIIRRRTMVENFS